MINSVSNQTVSNICKINFKSSTSQDGINVIKYKDCNPHEKKEIRLAALIGGLSSGIIGTTAIAMWNQIPKKDDFIKPDYLKPTAKQEFFAIVIAGLFIAAIGGILLAWQTKNNITLAHNRKSSQNNNKQIIGNG